MEKKRFHIKRKPISFINVFLLSTVCLALTSCSRQENNPPTELTFIHGWGGAVKTHVLMQEIYDEFAEENPDIVLNSQPSSDSTIAVEKANDMLALDEMPNIVSTNGQSYYVSNVVKQGKALNLAPYIEEDPELKASIHPSVLEVWTNEDGSIYTLPDALEVMGYWYNKQYFTEAGIVDERGEASPPATWDEFYEACEKLEQWNQKTGTLKGVYALENVQVAENLFLARLAGESEEGYQMAGGVPDTFDYDAFRNTVKDFSNLYRYSSDTDSIDNARQYFIEGKTAMYFNGVWESEIFQDSKNREDIACADYPTRSGESLSYISPSSGYVVYDSPDKKQNEASVRFLKYMLGSGVQTRLALETGQAPSNPDVDNQVIAKGYPMLGNALKTAHDAQIQIKTISSVWSNSHLNLIAGHLKAASGNEDELNDLILQLDSLQKGDEKEINSSY